MCNVCCCDLLCDKIAQLQLQSPIQAMAFGKSTPKRTCAKAATAKKNDEGTPLRPMSGHVVELALKAGKTPEQIRSMLVELGFHSRTIEKRIKPLAKRALPLQCCTDANQLGFAVTIIAEQDGTTIPEWNGLFTKASPIVVIKSKWAACHDVLGHQVGLVIASAGDEGDVLDDFATPESLGWTAEITLKAIPLSEYLKP